MDNPEQDIRESICEAGRRLWLKGWVAASDGNISARSGDGGIIITPSGVPKGFMIPEMLVRTDLNGAVPDRGAKPSSEILMHLEIYRRRNDIRAVVHAHPPVSTGFAVAHLPLDLPILPEIMLTMGTVPLAPYGTPSTHELADAISGLVAGHDAILLANHGVVTMGKTVMEAYYLMEKVEQYAAITLAAHQLGSMHLLNEEQIQKLREIHNSTTGGNFSQ